MKRVLIVVLALQSHAFAQTTPMAIPPIVDHTAILNGRDGRTTVEPCANFYRYACGGWIERTQISKEKDRVSRQVTASTDASIIRLNKILTAYAAGDFSTPSKYSAKLGEFYSSCLAVDRQMSKAAKSIAQQARELRKYVRRGQLTNALSKLANMGVRPLFRIGSMRDPKDSSRTILALEQGGMSFASKTYYFDRDAKAVEIRKTFVEYVAKLFELLGETRPSAKLAANRVLKFETRIAESALTQEERNDPEKTNNPADLARLSTLLPSVDWPEYLKEVGLNGWNEVIVEAPTFLKGVDRVLKSSTEDEIATYLVFRILKEAAPDMGGAFESAHFTFWSKYLSGAKQPEPRWKSCTLSAAKLLAYPLAEAYVSTFNGRPIQEKTELMIEQIKTSFLENLIELNRGPNAWIDDATLPGAQNKVRKVQQKVGAPSTFLDYDAIQVRRDTHLQNVLTLTAFEFARDLNKIGKPSDKSEWFMMPWEVNAYYERSDNQFVFPFGIFQPPSMDLNASDGANFGSFGGGTIGHELLHGFDKNGAKYDADGNLKNWWSSSTGAEFEKRAQCFIDQANAYKIEDVGLSVNGAMTIDENLADQGGVKLGYRALDTILASRAEVSWEGYSERQQYWLAYAQSWCGKMTNERLRKQLLEDNHPPSEFRVNGIMMNRPEFARDFNCQAGAPMAPVSRCTIW